MTAAKVVQCKASFSRASTRPSATLQRRLTAQLRRGFISSSEKDGQAAVKADVKDRQIDASNFMNKNRLGPAEVAVGNGLRVDVTVSPSSGILKQTTIMDEGFRPVYLDMKASTPTGPCVLDSILPIYTGRNINSHPRTHAYGWETETVIDVPRQRVAKLTGGHPTEIISTARATGSNDASVMYVGRFHKSKKYIIALQRECKCMLDLCQHLQDEGYETTYLPVKNNGLINLERLEKEIRPTALVSIMMVNNEIGVIQQEIGKLYRKQDIFHTNGTQAMGEIPVEPGKRNIDWMNISGAKAFRSEHIGIFYIRCGLKASINPLISGGGGEHGLRRGILAHSFVIGFGESHRIAPEGVKYTRTPEPSISLNSIYSSTVRDDYIREIYHNKQPKQFTRALSTKSHSKAVTKNGKGNATTKDSKVGIRKANLTDTTKWRNRKWTTSYSNMSIPEAEKRLKLSLDLPGIPVKEMLEGKNVLLGPKVISEVKREIYKGLVRYLKVGGYPTEANPDFREANINDIVVLTIYPLLALFKDETMRNLHLSREKEITSIDSSTSGMEEFVVMDRISYDQKDYVLVVEAKKVSLGQARKQCFLSLKDMWDHNGDGTVYGFVTMGDHWRMVSFDGKFKISDGIVLLFDSMAQDEEKWMADYSILVDCFNIALSQGGKGMVEVD